MERTGDRAATDKLTEGCGANTVTHVRGVRAFDFDRLIQGRVSCRSSALTS